MGDQKGTAEKNAHDRSPTPNGVESFGYRQELKRSLGLGDLLVYGLVFMVPIAPFAIFGLVFNASKGMVPLTYLIGFVAMVFTALSYREMSRAFPVAGSVYAYAGRGISRSAGFLAGWAILLDYLLIPTLLFVIGATALHSLVSEIPQWAMVVAFVAATTAVNLSGIEVTARLNKLFLVAELLVLGAFLACGVVAVSHGTGGAAWTTRPLLNPHVFSSSLVFGALSVAVLSFLGFDAISTLSEEVQGGPRLVGRATLLALCLATVLFVAQTYVAACLVPGRTEFVGEDATNEAFYTISYLAGGQGLKVLVVATSAFAGLANALVAQAATSRLVFAMARDAMLPRGLAHIGKRRAVPERGVLLVSAVSLILGTAFVGQVGLLSSLVNFGALFAFLLLHASVLVQYMVRDRSRNYALHLAVPVVGLLIIGYVLANISADAKIGGAAWLVAGLLLLLARTHPGDTNNPLVRT